MQKRKVKAAAPTGIAAANIEIEAQCRLHGNLFCRLEADPEIDNSQNEKKVSYRYRLIEGTDVSATTIHALFDLDGDLIPKLNLAKQDDPKVAFLLQLEVLMLDEVGTLLFFFLSRAGRSLSCIASSIVPCHTLQVSMIDDPSWNVIAGLLSTIDDSRRPNVQKDDDVFGHIHLILFGGRPTIS